MLVLPGSERVSSGMGSERSVQGLMVGVLTAVFLRLR